MKILRQRILLILPVLICLAATPYFSNRIVSWLDQKYFDLLFSFSFRPVPEHPVSLVVKDQSFSDRFGRDPDRLDMARVVHLLNRSGVRTAALDLIYDKPQTPETDKALIDAFHAFPGPILAQRFVSRSAFSGLETVSIREGSDRPPPPLPILDSVSAATFGTGIINILAGMDEVTRTMPLGFFPQNASEFVPSLGFAAWLHNYISQAKLPVLTGSEIPNIAKDDFTEKAKFELLKLWNQAPFGAPDLGHKGISLLARRWEGRHLANYLSKTGSDGAKARSAWLVAADELPIDSLPSRSWVQWPEQPIPWIGEENYPALRIAFTKRHGPISSDGLSVISMSALLGSLEGEGVPELALKRSSIEIFPAVDQTPQSVPIAFPHESPGTAVCRGTAIEFSGKPLAGVSVFAQRTSGGFWATTSTDLSGAFELNELPPGTYAVELSWVASNTHQMAVHEAAVQVASVSVLSPARFYPGQATLTLPVLKATESRELILTGEPVWVELSGPDGKLPWPSPPHGFDMTVLETDETLIWKNGQLVDSMGVPRQGLKVALTEPDSSWKFSWFHSQSVHAGLVEVQAAGLPPCLGTRCLLTRKSDHDEKITSQDADIVLGMENRLSQPLPDTGVTSGAAEILWQPIGVTSSEASLLLIGKSGISRQVSPFLPVRLESGKYRLLLTTPSGRGGYDPIASRFRRNPVFIGTHLAEDQDFRICPLNFWDSSFPTIYGLNLHAQLFSCLARQDFLKPTILHEDTFPRAWPLLTLLVLMPLIFISDSVFMKHGAIRGGSFTILLGLLWLGGSIWLFSTQRLLPVALPLSVFFFFGTSRGYLAYIQSRRREQETRGTFGRFVSAQMVDEILKNPEALKPGGEKRTMTVMFTDLAGFTSISEVLSPEELTRLMNEYLDEMTCLLFQFGGTLDKYIGDAVMAFWNYPLPQEDHAVRGVRCAIAMQKRLSELRPIWRARGLPDVYMRAGLNTADCMVGFFGCSVQMNFTCLGDGVNLASRLEGANKAYDTLMMISESTAKLLEGSDIRFRLLDFLAVKGKHQPIKVFEVIGEKGDNDAIWQKVIPMYEDAINLYLARNWDKAETVFHSILESIPNDGPSKTYIERCAAFRAAPPPDNWDGRFILKTK